RLSGRRIDLQSASRRWFRHEGGCRQHDPPDRAAVRLGRTGVAFLGARCRRRAGAMKKAYGLKRSILRRISRNTPNAWGRRLVILVPYAWLAVFFLVPFLIVLKISLSQTALAQPPYTPVLDAADGLAGLREFVDALSLDNYALLASDPIYLISYVRSVSIAVLSTALLLLIGFPLAY